MIYSVLAVALGGAIGSAARFGVNQTAAQILGQNFPWATLLVNVFGSFVMGFVMTVLLLKLPNEQNLQLFLTTGILGGFTTFSAFSFDVLNLLQRGENITALVYATASVVFSIIAVFAGFMLSRVFAG